MNIVSYNMLHENNKVNEIIARLKKTQFSICCLQGVSPAAYEKLGRVFKCAGFEAHQNDDVEHGVAILYGPKVVKCSDPPKFKYPLNWRRSKVCCDFIVSDKILRVMSIYFDQDGPAELDLRKYNQPKLQSLQEIIYYNISLNYKAAGKIDALVIAGDINEGVDAVKLRSSRFQLLQDLGYRTVLSNKYPPDKTNWIFCKDVAEEESI